MDQNDEPKAEEKAVEETTPETSPAPEAPPTQEQTEPSDEPQGMTPEQRKAFQDQRLEIKRLREEQEARRGTESAFAPFRPQVPTGGVDINRYTDPNTGVTDWNSYNNAVAQNASAIAAESAREQVDELRAREKYPDIFADPDLEKLVADQWLADKLRGKSTPVSVIASGLARRLGRAVSKAEKVGAEKMLQEVTPKEQANIPTATTSATAQKASSAEDLEQLRIQSRGKGRESEEAIAKRMKGIPWK